MQHQQQEQQHPTVRPPVRPPATHARPAKPLSPDATPAPASSSNGDAAKPAPRKSASRQGSITRLSTTTTQPTPPAETPSDARPKQLILRQTSASSHAQNALEATPPQAVTADSSADAQRQKLLSRQTPSSSESHRPLSRQTSSSTAANALLATLSQGSSSALGDWQSLLADTTAAPIKLHSSKARHPPDAQKPSGPDSTRPSSSGKHSAAPSPSASTAAPALQPVTMPSAQTADTTGGPAVAQSSTTGSTAARGTGVGSSRVTGQSAGVAPAGQKPPPQRPVSAVTTAKLTVVRPAAELQGTDMAVNSTDLPSATRAAEQRSASVWCGTASSVSQSAGAQPGKAAAPTEPKGLPTGARPERQRQSLFGSSTASAASKPGAAAPTAGQAADPAGAATGPAGTSSAPSTASARYSKLMATLSGGGQPPRSGGAQVRPPLLRGGTSGGTGRETALLGGGPALAAPLNGQLSAVKTDTAGVTLPKVQSGPGGPQPRTAVEAASRADMPAASAASADLPPASTMADTSSAAAVPVLGSAPSQAVAVSVLAASKAQPKRRASPASAATARLGPHAKPLPSIPPDAAAGAAATPYSNTADGAAADATASARVAGPHSRQLRQYPVPALNTAVPPAEHSLLKGDRRTADASPKASTTARDTPFTTAELVSAVGDDDGFFAAASDSPVTVPALKPALSTPAAAASGSPTATQSGLGQGPSDTIHTQNPTAVAVGGLGTTSAGAGKHAQKHQAQLQGMASADSAAMAALKAPSVQPSAATSPALPDHFAAAAGAAEPASLPATTAAPSAAVTKTTDRALVLPPFSTAAASAADTTAVGPPATAQAKAALPAAVQACTAVAPKETSSSPFGEDQEDSRAEPRSGFIPIPFGGSSVNVGVPNFAAPSLQDPFKSHADADDDPEDSFFDSIGTGAASQAVWLACEYKEIGQRICIPIVHMTCCCMGGLHRAFAGASSLLPI